jgi:hypothetical protein
MNKLDHSILGRRLDNIKPWEDIQKDLEPLSLVVFRGTDLMSMRPPARMVPELTTFNI